MAKKLFKRMLALVMAIVLVIGQVAVPASAEDGAAPQEQHGSTSVIGNETNITVTEIPGEPIVVTEGNTTTTTENSSAVIEGEIVSAPEVPEVPEVPETPDVPETPETPDVPEVPENPDVPENPENPETPENPEDPEDPEVPEGEPLTEEEMPDVSGVTDVNKMGDAFTDNAGNTWNVSSPAAGENNTTIVTMTREEVIEHDAKMTQEELGAILGVTLTAAGTDTYTYVDTDGVTVTVSVSDNSTETDTTTFTVTLTQTKEVVEVNVEEDLSETEGAKDAIETILNQATYDEATGKYFDEAAEYVITETVTDMTAEELAALPNAELVKLLGEGYSEADGKIYDAAGHVLTVSTANLEGKTIIRTMVKTEKVSQATMDETEDTAIQNAVEKALEGTGVSFANGTLSEDGTTYTYVDANGKTHTYTIDTATGEPVVTPVAAEEGADSTQKNTVTVTATVTGEQIVGTETVGTTNFQKNEDGTWKIFNGYEVKSRSEDGTLTIVDEKGVTYTYTVTSESLSEAEQAKLMEDGKTYDFSDLQKISWTATTTTTTTSTDTETLQNITPEGIDPPQGIVKNGNGSYTLTINNEDVTVTKGNDGKYYANGSVYEITETAKTVDQVKALLDANEYAYENVVAVTDEAGSITGYTVTGTNENGSTWEMLLPALSSYSVTQTTAKNAVDTWTGDITAAGAEDAAIAEAKQTFIQKIIAEFKKLAVGDKIVLGSGDDEKILVRDKEDITEEAIAEYVTSVFEYENYDAWIEAGTAVNFDAMSPDALKEMLNDMAEDAQNTAYDFNSYINEYKVGLNAYSNTDATYDTGAKALSAAIKDPNSPLIYTDANGVTHDVTMTRKWIDDGWDSHYEYSYTYKDDNGATQSVAAENVGVANYMNAVGHLDLGIDGTMKMQQDGKWVTVDGFILPTGDKKIQVVWGDTAEDVVIDGDNTGLGDGTAKQSSNGISKDSTTKLYEYEVRNGSEPESSQFYRLQADFVYDPVKDANGNIKEYVTDDYDWWDYEGLIAQVKAENPGCYLVERKNDDGKLESLQVYKKKADLLAYGYMTREANTCSNMVRTDAYGYDLTLSDLTLIDGKVYAGNRGTLNMILDYEVVKSYVAEQQGAISGVKTTTTITPNSTNGYSNYGSFTVTEETVYGDDSDYVGTGSYSYKTSNFASSVKKYNGEMDYTYITAKGEKETVAVRKVNANLDFMKVITETTTPGGGNPGGGNPGGGDGPGDGGPGDGGVAPAAFFGPAPAAVPLLVDLPEEEVPLAPAPMIHTPDGLEVIEDDEVPLADAPGTGDGSLIWGAMAVMSMGGYTFLGKKKEDEEEA